MARPFCRACNGMCFGSMTLAMSQILCIGSVLWDIIGHSASPMQAGADVPGRIVRHPGGVALNIARALRRFGLHPILLSALGHDTQGDDLLAACRDMGLNTDHIYRCHDLPTDRYMAIEAAGNLIAAIADAHTLEAAGEAILTPLQDGRLGSEQAPCPLPVALDGNLTKALLARIATSPLFASADLRVAPASPGKAERLAPFLDHANAVLYVNLIEAGLLCGASFDDAPGAARGLLDRGACRVLVTDGANAACDGSPDGLITGRPPQVAATRITGAGDTFMAAHIAADLSGEGREAALAAALEAAARHVAGDTAP